MRGLRVGAEMCCSTPGISGVWMEPNSPRNSHWVDGFVVTVRKRLFLCLEVGIQMNFRQILELILTFSLRIP